MLRIKRKKPNIGKAVIMIVPIVVLFGYQGTIDFVDKIVRMYDVQPGREPLSSGVVFFTILACLFVGIVLVGALLEAIGIGITFRKDANQS